MSIYYPHSAKIDRLLLLLFVRPTHLLGRRKWTVLPISSRCTSELEKDPRSCVPDVSVFTCSLWECPDHVMGRESHVSERCFWARSQEKGIIIITFKPNHGPLAAKKVFFKGHHGHTKGRRMGNSRHYQVLVKLWMRGWWSVYRKTRNKAELMPFKALFSNHH